MTDHIVDATEMVAPRWPRGPLIAEMLAAREVEQRPARNARVRRVYRAKPA